MRERSRSLQHALDRAQDAIDARRAQTFRATRLPYADNDYAEEQPMKNEIQEPQIIKWTPGTKINAPGIYDMPIEAYHSDCCDGPSVSSSGLRTIDTKSLAHYWADSYLNPDREPFEPTASMILGSAAHHLLLGESGFAQKFALRPTEAPDGRAWNGNNLSCKKWVAERALEGKTVITLDQIERIKGMAASLARHPLVRDGLLNGHVEKSMIVKDPETGIWLKSRPDAMPRLDAGDMVADLKTTADASANECERTVVNYGYHMQMALTGVCLNLLTGRAPGNQDYVLIFVETDTPFAVSVRPIDPNAIHYGRMQLRRALRKLATALETKDFPAYDNDTTTLSLPKWYQDRLEGEIKYGLLQDVA